MKEQHTGQVCLEEVDGSVLTAFVSFMYGKLHQLADDMLLPLFALADAHQVTLVAQHVSGTISLFLPGSVDMLACNCLEKHICVIMHSALFMPSTMHKCMLQDNSLCTFSHSNKLHSLQSHM